MGREIEIGYTHKSYTEERNIYGHSIPGYRHVQRRTDPFKFMDHAYFGVFHKSNTWFHNLNYPLKGADLYHFFNGVCLNKQNWVSTFETALPRVPKISKQLLQHLASSSCKKLIAMSECAMNIQQALVNIRAPDLEDEILSKCTVLHPPQEAYAIELDFQQSFENNLLKFCMVGREFFLKGGLEVLKAFERLFQQGYSAKLHIVSTLEFSHFSQHNSESELNEVKSIISRYSNNISYTPSMSHNEVQQLFRNSHCSLMPSYADTYGYVILESQANGCPVITTDIRAFPEINSAESGFVINVPKNELNQGRYSTKKEKTIFSEIVTNQLEEHLKNIINDPRILANKRAAGLRRIQMNHNPITFREELRAIYSQSI